MDHSGRHPCQSHRQPALPAATASREPQAETHQLRRHQTSIHPPTHLRRRILSSCPRTQALTVSLTGIVTTPCAGRAVEGRHGLSHCSAARELPATAPPPPPRHRIVIVIDQAFVSRILTCIIPPRTSSSRQQRLGLRSQVLLRSLGGAQPRHLARLGRPRLAQRNPHHLLPNARYVSTDQHPKGYGFRQADPGLFDRPAGDQRCQSFYAMNPSVPRPTTRRLLTN